MISRILIVGNGSIARRHFRIAHSLFPDADIKVVKNRENSSESLSGEVNFIDISEAVAFQPNIAVVANPATFHIETARWLANAGVHLLIEKPLSASVDGVKDLIQACQKKSIVLLVGYNLRFKNSLRVFRKHLKDGIVGKILSVRCEAGHYLPNWRPEADYRECVSARKDLGGGVLLELSHEIGYLQWIFGNFNWVNAKLSHLSNLDINVEDSAHIIFSANPKFHNGEIVGSLNLDFIRHDKTRGCTVIGEKGTICWDGIKDSVELYERSSNTWENLYNLQDQPDDSYIAEWSFFIDSIIGRHRYLTSSYDSLGVLSIIEAVRISNLNDGVTQKVNYIPQTEVEE